MIEIPAFFPLTTSIPLLTPPRILDLAAVEWNGRHLIGLYRNAELLVRIEKMADHERKPAPGPSGKPSAVLTSATWPPPLA